MMFVGLLKLKSSVVEHSQPLLLKWHQTMYTIFFLHFACNKSIFFLLSLLMHHHAHFGVYFQMYSNKALSVVQLLTYAAVS